MPSVEIPEPQYARNGPVSIAYLILGDGPDFVLYLAPGINHLDLRGDYPPQRHIDQRLTAIGSLVMYDKRGSGLSDRTVDTPTVMTDVGDAVAVLDAVGADRAHLFGVAEGAATALALAATHPERVSRVALYGAFAKPVAEDGYPHGWDRAFVEESERRVAEEWGGTLLLDLMAPNHDAELASWFRRSNRAGVSPAGAEIWFRNLMNIDIRTMLPQVKAPVLLTGRSGVPPEMGPAHHRYLVEHLPDARYVEFPGDDFLMWVGEVDPILDEVEEFFTGTRPRRAPSRALATVMFTDIVGSTEQAADLGDEAWRELLGRHDDLTRHHAEEHGGRVVKSTGDGALATFDDPEDAIAAAQSLIAELKAADLDIRVGIHGGKIEITGDDVAGIAVHLAARISALAGPGDIYISRSTADLTLGSAIEFDERGTHDLKGIPGTWDILAVTSG